MEFNSGFKGLNTEMNVLYVQRVSGGICHTSGGCSLGLFISM